MRSYIIYIATIRCVFLFSGTLLLFPTVVCARVDNGDGFFGGTGILCQKLWSFERDVKKGRYKVIGIGYKNSKISASEKDRGAIGTKVPVIIATGVGADGSTILYCLEIFKADDGEPAVCLYNEMGDDDSSLSNFRFYHEGKLDY